MTDIPQPAPNPYDVDDHVRIYLDSTDQDAHHHGTVCRITDVLVDDFGAETERPMDSYSYRLVAVETGEELPITFRHRDLVPADSDTSLTE
jgi:hypothetical protein